MSDSSIIIKKLQIEKYNIFKELEKNKICIIEETDKKPWWGGMAREIGQLSNSVTIYDKEKKSDIKAILPPMSNQYQHYGVVIINKDVILREEPINDIKSKFKFRLL